MRKIKEVLRLKYDCGLSAREIARSCQVSRSTVADYLMKAPPASLPGGYQLWRFPWLEPAGGHGTVQLPVGSSS
jgi:hypothetical protein